MSKRYYVDQDFEDDLLEDDDGAIVNEDWYVFDSEQEPHKAISSWCSKEDAQDHCDRMNGDIKEPKKTNPNELIDRLNELVKVQREALDSKDKLIKALDELSKGQARLIEELEKDSAELYKKRLEESGKGVAKRFTLPWWWS
jgi:hypothetical protein